MNDKKLRELIEKHVPGLSVIIFVFAMIEFGILIVCVAYSANQDIVKIYNPENELVYENVYNMSYITEFKKIYGIENLIGEGFVVTRVGKDTQFPVRAWVALSICVPMVLILFLVFIVKVFEDVFPSKEKDKDKDKEKDKEKDKKANPESDFEETSFQESSFEKLFSTLGRLNIYALGCTVISIVFLYWMIPDLLMYLGKISFQTISELKWVIFSVVVVGGIYLIINVFLAYKTKKEILKQQAEIQKNRDRLAIEAKLGKKLLEDHSSGSKPVIAP